MYMYVLATADQPDQTRDWTVADVGPLDTQNTADAAASKSWLQIPDSRLARLSVFTIHDSRLTIPVIPVIPIIPTTSTTAVIHDDTNHPAHLCGLPAADSVLSVRLENQQTREPGTVPLPWQNFGIRVSATSRRVSTAQPVICR